MKKYIFLVNLFLIFMPAVFAGATAKKGDWFVFWGWNRGTYSNSDIRFTGNGYDFTLYDVQASDAQSDISPTYLLEPTIPQTNSQLGYYIDNHQAISFAVDHMKYVVNSGQTVKASGSTSSGSISSLTTGEGTLLYEHTDGLNYINMNYEYNLPLWVSPSDKHALVLLAGAGAGFMMPRSNVTLAIENKTRNDQFHISGVGTDIHVGLDINVFENIFIRNVIKGGLIYLPDVTTSSSDSDKASQSFFFAQWILAVGYRF